MANLISFEALGICTTVILTIHLAVSELFSKLHRTLTTCVHSGLRTGVPNSQV